MKFIKKLFFLSASPKAKSEEKYLLLTVQCARCQEIIQARIDLENDLSAEYGEDEKEVFYFCRKVLIGKQNCFVPIEVELKFDNRRRLLERQITGGFFKE